MRIILSTLLLTVCFVLSAQERISDFSGGFAPVTSKHVGSDDEYLYYYTESDLEYVFLRESIVDDKLSSEILFRRSLNKPFFNVHYHAGHFVFPYGRLVELYKVETDVWETVAFDDSIVDYYFSEGVIFGVHNDGVFVVNLEDYEVSMSPHLTYEQVERSSQFYSSDEKVLRDSLLLTTAQVDERISFSKLNLHTGNETNIVTLGENELIFVGQKGENRDYLLGEYNGAAAAFIVKYTEDDIEIDIKEITVDISNQPRHISEEHIMFYDFGSRIVTVQNLDDQEVVQYEVSETRSPVVITPFGFYYFTDGNLVAVTEAGEEVVYEGGEVGSYRLLSSNNRSTDNEVAEGKYLITFLGNSGTYKTLELSADGVVEVDERAVAFTYFDELLDKKVFVKSDVQSLSILGTYEDDASKDYNELTELREGGADFDNPRNVPSIYFTENSRYDQEIFVVEDDVVSTFEVTKEEGSFSFPIRATTSTHFHYRSKRVDRTTLEVEELDFSNSGYILNERFSTPKEDLPLFVRQNSIRFVALIKGEEIFVPSSDKFDPGIEPGIAFDEMIIDSNGDIYVLAVVENDNTVLVKVSPDGETITELVEIGDDPYVDIFSDEGENHLVFTVNNRAYLYNKASGVITNIDEAFAYRGYSNGRFYFSRVMIDDTTGEVTDVSAIAAVYLGDQGVDMTVDGLVRIDLVSGNVTELVDVEEGFFIPRSYNGHAIFTDLESPRVVVSDGTPGGSSIRMLPDGTTSLNAVAYANGTVIVLARSEDIGTELMAINSDNEVIDLQTFRGSKDGRHQQFYLTENHLYFTGISEEKGRQLYRVDLNDIVSGVEEVSTKAHFSLTPNPVSTTTLIQSDVAFDHVTITDLTGRTVLKQKISATSEYQLNVASLPVGNYAISLRSEQGEVMTTLLSKQ